MRRIAYLIIFLAAPLFGQTVTAYDTNDDGKADKWIEEMPDGHKKISVDSNYDGNIDGIIRFDKTGRTDYEAYDFDKDGKIDTYYYYGEEGLDRQEIDSNGDGKIDIWVHMIDGMYMKSYEEDTDFDGTVDVVKEYGKK